MGTIRFEQYDKKAHKQAMISILRSRNMPEDYELNLPVTGVLAFGEDGVVMACGFIRYVEGGYGMMDSFITNPATPMMVRTEALMFIMKTLQDTAKKELKFLIVLTVEPGIARKAIKFGGKMTDFKVIVGK